MFCDVANFPKDPCTKTSTLSSIGFMYLWWLLWYNDVDGHSKGFCTRWALTVDTSCV